MSLSLERFRAGVSFRREEDLGAGFSYCSGRLSPECFLVWKRLHLGSQAVSVSPRSLWVVWGGLLPAPNSCNRRVFGCSDHKSIRLLRSSSIPRRNDEWAACLLSVDNWFLSDWFSILMFSVFLFSIGVGLRPPMLVLRVCWASHNQEIMTIWKLPITKVNNQLPYIYESGFNSTNASSGFSPTNSSSGLNLTDSYYGYFSINRTSSPSKKKENILTPLFSCTYHYSHFHKCRGLILQFHNG